MIDQTVVIIFSFLMLPGLVFTFVPIMPSLGYMMSLALVYGLLFNSQNLLSGQELLILGIMAIVAFLIDFLSGALGAYLGGASKKSISAGIVGLTLGFLILPPLGSFLGLFLAVFISEIYLNKNKQQALKSATGSIIGVALGAIINITIGISFIVLFLLFALSV